MNEISKLIGHKYILNELIYLEQIKKLPNKILLNGPKGIGKKPVSYTHLTLPTIRSV